MGNTEHREHAQKRTCRQCSTRASQSEQKPIHQQWTGKRAPTRSSTSTSSSKKLKKAGDCSIRQRQQHTECVPADRCGDTFAEDLGQIIDSILKDHANTLQDVIDNIKTSQPSLEKLQRVSGELVQRCQTASCCVYLDNTSCQLPCKHQTFNEASDSISEPFSGRQQTPLYDPPKEAEKLNIGSPGKVGPNINDPHSNLLKVVKSVPDLVDLVRSAADDFGVDLEAKPSAQDEEIFHNAPYESISCCSGSSCGDNHLDAMGETIIKDEENSWLQQARRQLTEILETREQLMSELDSIAGDLGVQFKDHQHPKSVADSIEPVLGEVSTESSTERAQPIQKSTDAVAEGTPTIINRNLDDERSNGTSTTISSQPGRSIVTKDVHEFSEIPPEEI